MPPEHDAAFHPEALELAAYLDGALTGEARARVEAHLAACGECRLEAAAVAELVRTGPGTRRLAPPLGLAAAAMLAVLLVPALDVAGWFDSGRHREPAVTTTTPPTAIAPRGGVDVAPALVWSAVPHATRYRVTLVDDAGTALWRSEATDTVAVLPDGVRLRPGSTYFWKVEAETGFDRWVASDLVDFTLAVPRR